MGFDDSTGKTKEHDKRSHYRRLGFSFAVGLMLGIIVAERAYLSLRTTPHLLHPGLFSETQFWMQSETTHVRKAETVNHGTQGTTSFSTLEDILKRVAPQKEVLLVIANSNLGDNLLKTWLQTVHNAGVENYLVIAIDRALKSMLTRQDVNVYLHELDLRNSVQHGTGDNHAISAKKYGIILEVIDLGWNVFLSDADVVILQNPFHHLHRDSDIEAMSDGFDEDTAYGKIEGFDDPSMGWSRYAQFVKHFNLNSGLFYLKSNNRTISLMKRLEARLNREQYWDQTALNEEIFFLSHGDYVSPQVTVRVLDIYKFMNSKTLFKFVRKEPRSSHPEIPVMVHINYHPDKHARMKAVVSYYCDKNDHALDSFPGGSAPGT